MDDSDSDEKETLTRVYTMEMAKSDRSQCRKSKCEKIAKGSVRFSVAEPDSERFPYPRWYHLECARWKDVQGARAEHGSHKKIEGYRQLPGKLQKVVDKVFDDLEDPEIMGAGHNKQIAKYIETEADERAEGFKRIGLKKAARVIRELKTPITPIEDITRHAGIGPGTADLIKEYFKKNSGVKVKKEKLPAKTSKLKKSQNPDHAHRGHHAPRRNRPGNRRPHQGVFQEEFGGQSEERKTPSKNFQVEEIPKTEKIA
eukprot:358755_1